MIFSDYAPLLQGLVVGGLAYLSLVALLRLAGKRTLAKWNAFDMVVTVAFGSILATAFVTDGVTLSRVGLAMTLLVLLQLLVSLLSVRSQPFRDLIRSEPRLLLYRGEMLQQGMKRERVTRGELLSATRQAGIGTLEDAGAVVLETDGSFSVIRMSEMGDESTLHDVVR